MTKARKKAVKKQPVKEPIAEASPDPGEESLPDDGRAGMVLVRNIHNTGIWIGACKLAPGHAADCDEAIVDKLLEAGFVEVME